MFSFRFKRRKCRKVKNILTVLLTILLLYIAFQSLSHSFISCRGQEFLNALCDEYKKGIIAGEMCISICEEKSINFTSCTIDLQHNYRIFHQHDFDLFVCNDYWNTFPIDLDSTYRKFNENLTMVDFYSIIDRYLFDLFGGMMDREKFILRLFDYMDVNRDTKISTSEARTLWLLIQNYNFLMSFLLSHLPHTASNNGFCGDVFTLNTLPFKLLESRKDVQIYINTDLQTSHWYKRFNVFDSLENFFSFELDWIIRAKQSLALVEFAFSLNDILEEYNLTLRLCPNEFFTDFSSDQSGNLLISHFSSIVAKVNSNELSTSGLVYDFAISKSASLRNNFNKNANKNNGVLNYKSNLNKTSKAYYNNFFDYLAVENIAHDLNSTEKSKNLELMSESPVSIFNRDELVFNEKYSDNLHKSTYNNALITIRNANRLTNTNTNCDYSNLNEELIHLSNLGIICKFINGYLRQGIDKKNWPHLSFLLDKCMRLKRNMFINKEDITFNSKTEQKNNVVITKKLDQKLDYFHAHDLSENLIKFSFHDDSLSSNSSSTPLLYNNNEIKKSSVRVYKFHELFGIKRYISTSTVFRNNAKSLNMASGNLTEVLKEEDMDSATDRSLYEKSMKQSIRILKLENISRVQESVIANDLKNYLWACIENFI